MVKQRIVRKTSTQKQFNYQTGVCTLSFILTLDNRGELLAYKSLLEQGIRDIEDTLREMQN